ncbi:hypothetical protein CY34DRAFT_111093, partial [Suillus luteus UH-Slu-Lm8-n1]
MSLTDGVRRASSPPCLPPPSPKRQRMEPPAISPRMQRSLGMLEQESHELRLRIGEKELEGKGTAKSYPRQVQNYQLWFDADQVRTAAEDSTRVPIPAFPVTAAKYKRGSKDLIQGSSLGKSHIAQVINALEKYRLNHAHSFLRDHETHISLRRDSRIRAFESASKHHEPKRVEKSQTVKAAGTSSDTYTKAELIRCSLWCLTDFSGPQYIFVGIRDRAMLLVSAATAFRGEGCHMLEWSDLFPATVPLDQTNEIQVLAALADNAKHNQTGRVDEHGAIRHVHPELCPVGALAFLFFAHFHILNCAPPDFSPDFSNKNYGEYGHRKWYDYHVFYTGSPTKEMTYEKIIVADHRDRIMTMHMKNNIDITKKTHAGRHYAAQTARAHGAS